MKKEQLITGPRFFLPFIFLFILSLISLLTYNKHFYFSLKEFVTLQIPFLIYLIVVYNLDNIKTINLILKIMIIIGILQIPIGLFQSFVIGSKYSAKGFEQAYGTMGDPLSLGIFLVIIFCLGLSYKIYNKISNISGTKLFFFLIIISIGIFLVFSRGIWLTFMSSMFFLYMFKNKLKSLIILFFVVIAVYILTLFYHPFQVRFLSIFSSNYDRVVIYEQGLNYFIENPIFGVGIGNSEVYNYVLYDRPAYSMHNTYLEFLVELGMFGLILFLWLIYNGLKITINNIKLSKNNPELLWINWWLLISLIVLLQISLTDTIYLHIISGYLFGFIFGISEVIRTKLLKAA